MGEPSTAMESQAMESHRQALKGLQDNLRRAIVGKDGEAEDAADGEDDAG